MLFSKAPFLGALYLIGTFGAEAQGADDSSDTTSSAFHLTLDLPGSRLRERAQTYINDTGYLTTDQSEATVYYISNNQLLTKSGESVSATTDDDYIVFAPSNTVEDISTVWTKNGPLQWSNKAFAGDGIATYCQGSDSRVYIVLQAEPDACKPAVAVPIPTHTPPPANGLVYYGYSDPDYSDDPTPYNGDTEVEITGIVQDVNLATDASYDYTFPGQTDATDTSQFAVVYQGYFLAPITSAYTITLLSQTDDYSYIWTGDKAYSAWDDTNFDGESKLNTQEGTVSFNLEGGKTLPLTMVWINTFGYGVFAVSIYEDATGNTYSSTKGFFTQPKKGDGFSNYGLQPIPT